MIESNRAAPGENRNSIILFAAVALLFIFARLWRLTTFCLWFDEIFSVHAARHDWSQLVKFVAADIIHPPLFYALLKIWMAIGGDSLLWLRLLPLTISVAALVPVCLICRELKLRAAETNLCLFLMAISGFLIKYAQEVRMYSLVFLLSSFSIWAFLKALNESRKDFLWILATINLLLVYTHYYGWILLAVETFIVLICSRKQFLRFIIAVFALALLYLPWIYEVLVSRETGKGLAQNLSWIARPGLRDLFGCFTQLSRPFVFAQSTNALEFDPLVTFLALLLFGVPVVLLCRRIMRARDFRSTETWLIAIAFAPVLIAFILSRLLPYAIWGARHLIVSAPAYFLVLAIAIARLRWYWMKIAVGLILGCWCLVAGTVSIIMPPPLFSWCAWEPLLKQIPIVDRSQPVEVYAAEDLIAYHLWYASSAAPASVKVMVVKNAGIAEDPQYFLPRRFDEIRTIAPSEIKGEDVWLAFRAANWDENRAPLNIFKAKGYQTKTVLSSNAQEEQAFLVEFRRGPEQ